MKNRLLLLQAMPRLLTLFAVLSCALVLAGCSWILGSTYLIRHPDPKRALTLDTDLEEFLGIVETAARKSDMLSVPCPESLPEPICRTYRTRDGIFLTGYLDPKMNQYVMRVYEWNRRQRADRALVIEAETSAALRQRFGENVVKVEPPPARPPRPLTDQDRR
jgi:hypothetical protein